MKKLIYAAKPEDNKKKPEIAVLSLTMETLY
jgi:hypothetical protein